MQHYQTAIARVLLASVFLGSVLLRVSTIMSTPDGYVQYQVTLGQLGLPAIFAPIFILVQLIGGLGLLLGFKTKFFASLLAALAFFLAVIVSKFDFNSSLLYMGIGAGMLLLRIYPQTACSLDNLKKS